MLSLLKSSNRLVRYNQLRLFSYSPYLFNKNINDINNNNNNKINTSSSNTKNRLNIPPSFRSSRPLQNQLSQSEIEKIKNSNNNNNNNSNNITPITYKKPWWIPFLKIAIVLLPCLIFTSGYIIYETINNRTVFFPFKINSIIPLNELKGFENIDIELLKSTSKDILLRRLNMNHEIKEFIGLPVNLGEFEKFDISIKFNKLSVEGIELDFRKNWLKPLINYRKIDSPQLPSNINKYIQPLKERINGDIDEDPEQDSIFLKEVDYKLIIRGTIPIINEKLNRIEPGTGKITFDAEVELDHTKLMKIVSALLHFKNKNGTGSGGTLEKLW